MSIHDQAARLEEIDRDLANAEMRRGVLLDVVEEELGRVDRRNPERVVNQLRAFGYTQLGDQLWRVLTTIHRLRWERVRITGERP